MIPNYVLNQNIQEQDILNTEKSKEELVKICLQTLQNFGYEKSCDSLIKESGIKIEESENLVKFRKAVLLGTWNKAIQQLESIEPKINEKELNKVKFLIFREKYLELLEQGNSQEALNVLRNQLTVFADGNDTQQSLNHLSQLIIYKNNDELRQKAGWKGAGIDSRKQLLGIIFQALGPQGNMMPPNRLQTILKQSKTYQIAECQFHIDIEDEFSLLEKHQCKKTDIPLQPVQIDNSHEDEVWTVKFSPDGKYMGSVSKNSSLILWEVRDNELEKRYVKKNAHKKEIHCLNWKPDSKLFGTASADKTVKIWSVKKLQCLYTLADKHTDIIFSVVWNPMNNHIYTAGIDLYISVYDSKKKRTVETIESERNLEIHVTNDGKRLISVGITQNRIGIIDIDKKLEIAHIMEKDQILSTFLSRDSKYLLTNISYKKPELKLYNLETLEVINKFSGYKQNSLILKCCLGWKQELIVACGSEDGRIFLWHKLHNKVTKIIKAPCQSNSAVNSITWNPVKPNMMVSAHDDNNIIVWSNKKKQSNNNLSDSLPVQESQSKTSNMLTALKDFFFSPKGFLARPNQLEQFSKDVEAFDKDTDGEAYFNRMLQYQQQQQDEQLTEQIQQQQQQQPVFRQQQQVVGDEQEYDDDGDEMEQEEQKESVENLIQQQVQVQQEQQQNDLIYIEQQIQQQLQQQFLEQQQQIQIQQQQQQQQQQSSGYQEQNINQAGEEEEEDQQQQQEQERQDQEEEEEERSNN